MVGYIYLFIHIVCAIGTCVLYMRYAPGCNENLDNEDFIWMTSGVVTGPIGLIIAVIATVANLIEESDTQFKNPFYKSPFKEK